MSSLIQKYGGFFLLFFGLIGIAVIGIKNRSTEVVTQTTSAVDYNNVTITSTQSGLVYVDVKGEVVYPGVYSVGSLMRIADVINMAGGLTNLADVSKINLSKNIYDQMVIYIPSSVELDVSQEQVLFYVDVKGAVSNPGVYAVPQGTRVYEVIALAGGFLENANSNMLNMSELVVDEMVLVIEFRDTAIPVIENEFKVYIGGEILHPSEYYVTNQTTLQELVTKAGGFTENADTYNLFMEMSLFEGFEIVIPSVEDTHIPVIEEDGLININTAKLEELMTLNGIGIILGQRIIDYRAEFGNFETIEDIMKVSGIKSSIYENIFKDIKV